MIVFLTTAAHRYTIGTLLERAGTPLTGRVLTLSYGEFLSWPRLPVGTYVFADVDRLRPDEAAAAARRIEALKRACPDARQLNHPLHSLGRLALLERLHAAGHNDFQARRADRPLAGLRYPVFIREAIEHRGAVGGLIDDAAALDTALAALAAGPLPLSAYLVIEFVDVRNADGHYEKYSVLKVGERLIASDLSFNDRWICKGDPDEAIVPGDIARDAAFQRDNPHVDALREVYALAGVDYGRVDYAFHRGRLQVFEINSNPMLPVPELAVGGYRDSTRRYLDGLLAGFAALPGYGAPPRWQAVPGAQPGRSGTRGFARRLLRRALARLGLLHCEPALLRNRHRGLRP